jgi:hypothetical protein
MAKQRDVFDLNKSLWRYIMPTDYTDPSVFTDEEKQKWREGGNLKLPVEQLPPNAQLIWNAAQNYAKLKGGDDDLATFNSPIAEEFFRRLFYRTYTEHQKDLAQGKNYWTWNKAKAAFQDTPHALWNTIGLPVQFALKAIAGGTASGVGKMYENAADNQRLLAKNKRALAERLSDEKQKAAALKEAEEHETRAQLYDKEAEEYGAATKGDLFSSRLANEFSAYLDEAMNNYALPEDLATMEGGAAIGSKLGPAGAVGGAAIGSMVAPFVDWAGRWYDTDERRKEELDPKKIGMEIGTNLFATLLGEAMLLKPKVKSASGKRVSVKQRNAEINYDNRTIDNENKAAMKAYEKEKAAAEEENVRLKQKFEDDTKAAEDKFVEDMEAYRDELAQDKELMERTRQRRTAETEQEVSDLERSAEATEAENRRLAAEYDQLRGGQEYRAQNLADRKSAFLGEDDGSGLSMFEQWKNRVQSLFGKDRKFLEMLEEDITPNVNSKWYRTWVEANPGNPNVVAMKEAEEEFLNIQRLLQSKQKNYQRLQDHILEQVERRGMTDKNAVKMLNDAWTEGKTIADLEKGAKLEDLSFSELAKLGKDRYQRLAPFKENLKGLESESLANIERDYPLFGKDADWSAHSGRISLADFKAGNFGGLSSVEQRILNGNPVDTWWDVQHLIRKGRAGNSWNYSGFGYPIAKNSMLNTATLYGGNPLATDIGHQLAREHGLGLTRAAWKNAMESLNAGGAEAEAFAKRLLTNAEEYNNLYRLAAYDPEAFGMVKQDLDRFLTSYALEHDIPIPKHMTREMNLTKPEVPFNRMTAETREAYNPTKQGPNYTYDYDPAMYDVEGRPLVETHLGADRGAFDLGADFSALKSEAVPKPPTQAPVKAPNRQQAFADLDKELDRDWKELRGLAGEKPVLQLPEKPTFIKPPKEPKLKSKKPLLKEGSEEFKKESADIRRDIARMGYYGYLVPGVREYTRRLPADESIAEELLPAPASQDNTAVYQDPDLPGVSLTAEEYQTLQSANRGKKTAPASGNMVKDKDLGLISAEDAELLKSLGY